MWNVRIRKSAAKRLASLPTSIQERFKALALELRTDGPIRNGWSNYGKIRGKTGCHHCHLKKGRPTYVAVWMEIDERSIEVRYVGTHEKAEYGKLC